MYSIPFHFALYSNCLVSSYHDTSDIAFARCYKKGYSGNPSGIRSSYSLGNVGFTVLEPVATDYEDYNNYSVVIMLQNGTDRFLITGDSEYTSEAQMCAFGRK